MFNYDKRTMYTCVIQSFYTARARPCVTARISIQPQLRQFNLCNAPGIKYIPTHLCDIMYILRANACLYLYIHRNFQQTFFRGTVFLIFLLLFGRPFFFFENVIVSRPESTASVDVRQEFRESPDERHYG